MGTWWDGLPRPAQLALKVVAYAALVCVFLIAMALVAMIAGQHPL